MNLSICDSLMGSGKTSAAINYMNRHKDMRFIYITPFLKEVERIIESCNAEKMENFYIGDYYIDDDSLFPESIYVKELCDGFCEPSKINGRKIEGLKHLLKDNRNIVTTHSLLREFDKEIIELISERNYTLILDEVTNVVEPYKISSKDKEYLFEKYVKVSDNNFLEWTDSEYTGKFEKEKKLCELNALSVYGKENNFFMWVLPIKSFSCFKKIMILTYMFDAQLQKYYFDMNNITYKYYIASKDNKGNYCFKKVDSLPKAKIDKSLINIYEGNYNDIGKEVKKQNPLSKTWYQKNEKDNTGELENLQHNVYNYIRNIAKAKSKDIMWSCYKDYRKYIKGNGYTKSFFEFNIRATNDLKDRSTVCYLVNLYYQPYIVNFFKERNITLDNDKYALSELLQFLWRSRIRENKPINLYLPSERMRKLLIDWLK